VYSIKIMFTGSPTLQPTTCGSTCSVSTVGSSQSKEFVALQQHTAQLTDKYNHLSAEYAQLKASQAQQRAESEQIKASQVQQKTESEQQKTAYEQLREMIMNMATHSGTCAPNPFWPYNHQPPLGSPSPPPAPPLY